MNTIGQNIYEGLELLPEDLQGWNSKHPIFKELILSKRIYTIIEVGSWKGGSAIQMGTILKIATGPDGEMEKKRIYCIDTWLGAAEFWTGDLANTPERNLLLKNGYPQIYYQFLSNVVHNGLQDYIIPIPVPSSIGVKILKAQGVKADLIYIDGSHEYDDVYADLNSYSELLNPGGVMFGDDYYSFADVGRAVNDFVATQKAQDIKKKLEIVNENFWVYGN